MNDSVSSTMNNTAETDGPATVAQFAAYLLDCVAEGLGDTQVVTTADDFTAEGDFFALDQHIGDDGTLDRPAVEWSSFSFGSLTAQLTEDQAMSLYQALKSQFGWSGTVFCRQDVAEAVSEHEGDEKTLTGEQRTALVDAVLDSRSYYRLDDRMAELGNEIIADEVSDAFNALRPRG